MNTLIHADIFFFLTGIVVVVCTIILVIAGIYAIQLLSDARALMRRIRRDGEQFLDAAEDVASSIAAAKGGVAAAIGGLGYRLWKAKRNRTRANNNKKSSK